MVASPFCPEHEEKMYLFVSVFLLVATMGLFTQVHLIQASHLWARQKAVAEMMLIWHQGAYALAKDKASSVTPDCSLSPTLPAGLASLCGVRLVSPTGAFCTGCSRHYLPVGYTWAAQYRFLSVAYVNGGQRYLATYVPKEAAGGTAWLGYRAAEILQQMKNAGYPKITYGQVIQGACNGANGRWFSTGFFLGNNQVCYPAASTTGFLIPVGSVGFVSSL